MMLLSSADSLVTMAVHQSDRPVSDQVLYSLFLLNYSFSVCSI